MFFYKLQNYCHKFWLNFKVCRCNNKKKMRIHDRRRETPVSPGNKADTSKHIVEFNENWLRNIKIGLRQREMLTILITYMLILKYASK